MQPIKRLRGLALAVAMATFALVQTSRAQTAVWTGGGSNENYTNPANWAGESVPLNNGTYTLDFNALEQGQDLNINANESVLGLSFASSESFFPYIALNAGGGALTIGSGGIVLTGGGYGEVLFMNAPIVLSANQTWNTSNAYFFDAGGISETGGPRTLTIGTGSTLYVQSSNSFSGGSSWRPVRT